MILLSIGSARAYGNSKVNLNRAKKRSEVPRGIMDKYLVNVPHKFYKVVDKRRVADINQVATK